MRAVPGDNLQNAILAHLPRETESYKVSVIIVVIYSIINKHALPACQALG